MNTRQSGSTTVEFALVMLLFLTIVFGIMDFARLLYMWNTANEVAREGARYAVVCADPSSNTRVLAKMQALMPDITASNIAVDWEPRDCTAATCEERIAGLVRLARAVRSAPREASTCLRLAETTAACASSVYCFCIASCSAT